LASRKFAHNAAPGCTEKISRVTVSAMAGQSTASKEKARNTNIGCQVMVEEYRIVQIQKYPDSSINHERGQPVGLMFVVWCTAAYPAPPVG
jgi:hypothetical protein